MTDYSKLETLFLGLADKTRLKLLGLMAAGPVPVAHLVAETGESQPKVSRHLAYLRNAGLVDTTRDGKWIYYGVSPLADESSDAVLRHVLEEITGDRRPAIRIPRRSAIRENTYEEPVRYDQDEDDESEGSPFTPNEIEIFLL